MAWNHTLATGIAALMSVTLAAAIPAVGSASTLSFIPPLEQANLQATVEAYSGLISSHYSPSPSMPAQAHSFIDLSHVSHDFVTRTANDEREMYREDGYDIVSASVTPHIRWQKTDRDGTIHILADLTTDIHSVPQGTHVSSARATQDCAAFTTYCLDSVLTDRHIMTVQPAKNSSTGMRIVSDRVLNPEEYDESLTLAPENASV
jgi:hypothetical protein